MNKKTNWMVSMSTLLVIATAATLFLVPSAMANTDSTSMSVNINTADTGELTSLPGIGNSKATAIVNYRSEHGLFATVDELANIQGIGTGILDKIRDLIRVQ